MYGLRPTPFEIKLVADQTVYWLDVLDGRARFFTRTDVPFKKVKCGQFVCYRSSAGRVYLKTARDKITFPTTGYEYTVDPERDNLRIFRAVPQSPEAVDAFPFNSRK